MSIKWLGKVSVRFPFFSVSIFKITIKKILKMDKNNFFHHFSSCFPFQSTFTVLYSLINF